MSPAVPLSDEELSFAIYQHRKHTSPMQPLPYLLCMLRLSSLTLYMRVHSFQGLLMYTSCPSKRRVSSARGPRTCSSRIPVSDPTTEGEATVP